MKIRNYPTCLPRDFFWSQLDGVVLNNIKGKSTNFFLILSLFNHRMTEGQDVYHFPPRGFLIELYVTYSTILSLHYILLDTSKKTKNKKTIHTRPQQYLDCNLLHKSLSLFSTQENIPEITKFISKGSDIK